jgi:P-type Cu+ transporter
MHPQIVRREHGNCPICGMTLEPMTAAAGEIANPELRDMTRRFWVGVALSVPLLAIAMAQHFDKAALDALISPRLLVWVQLILGTPAVLWGGWPFFQRGWASVVNRRLNMFTLIALGTGVAYVYSLVAALAPGIFPASFRDHDGQVPLYFEAAAVIVTLVLLGQVLELRARSQTRPAAPSAPCLIWHPSGRAGCARTAATRMSRSKILFPAIACACARARKCRLTAWCSKATARSMNP